MNYIEAYWKEIKGGKVQVSKRVKTQYKRLVADLKKKGKYG